MTYSNILKRRSVSGDSAVAEISYSEKSCKTPKRCNYFNGDEHARRWRLLSLYDVPPFLQFNPYIRTGYRPALGFCGCCSSIFKKHNESVNILTHISGLIFAFYVLCQGVLELEPGSGYFEYHNIVCGISLLFIYFSSVTYHLFMPMCQNQTEYESILLFDVVGCILGISLSASSFIFYGYRCLNMYFVIFPMFLFFFTSTIVTLYIALFSKSARDRFVTIGGHCLLRLACGIITLGTKAYFESKYSAFVWHIGSFFLLTIGGIININRLPERFFPGSLDYYFNSHEIWHCLTLGCGIATYLGTRADAADWISIDCSS